MPKITTNPPKNNQAWSFLGVYYVFCGLIFSTNLWAHALPAESAVVHTSASAYTGKIFDSHLHYGAEDTQALSTAEVLRIFDRNQVTHALISSTPDAGTQALYQAAPERIIPFLNLYLSLKEKGRWGDNPEIIQRLQQGLKTGIYQGIGEFHLFKEDRNSPVLRELVAIAKAQNLKLQVHGDAEIVDEIFAQAPNSIILWAHLGTQPEPQFLAKMLQKHPHNLYIDTTVRDAEFVDAQGKLKAEWRDFFTTHANKILVGVDTFSVNRWHNFDAVVAQIRHWLGQLPPEVAHQLAYENARGLFLSEH